MNGLYVCASQEEDGKEDDDEVEEVVERPSGKGSNKGSGQPQQKEAKATKVSACV